MSNMKDYDSLDAFDRDVHAMLHQGQSLPNTATTATAASDYNERPVVSAEASEAEPGQGGTRGEIVMTRREALTEEFAARAALNRIRVESIIRFRRDVAHRVPAGGGGS